MQKPKKAVLWLRALRKWYPKAGWYVYKHAMFRQTITGPYDSGNPLKDGKAMNSDGLVGYYCSGRFYFKPPEGAVAPEDPNLGVFI